MLPSWSLPLSSSSSSSSSSSLFPLLPPSGVGGEVTIFDDDEKGWGVGSNAEVDVGCADVDSGSVNKVDACVGVGTGRALLEKKI